MRLTVFAYLDGRVECRSRVFDAGVLCEYARMGVLVLRETRPSFPGYKAAMVSSMQGDGEAFCGTSPQGGGFIVSLEIDGTVTAE